MPEMLGMVARTPAEHAAPWLRLFEPRFSEHPRDARIPVGAMRRRAVLRIEELVDEPPHPFKTCDHPFPALVCTIAEAHHPFVREARVIGDLLQRFLTDGGQPWLRRRRDLPHQQFLPVREQELTRDGLGEIAIRLLDQQTIAKVESIAMKSECVGVAAL